MQVHLEALRSEHEKLQAELKQQRSLDEREEGVASPVSSSSPSSSTAAAPAEDNTLLYLASAPVALMALSWLLQLY